MGSTTTSSNMAPRVALPITVNEKRLVLTCSGAVVGRPFLSKSTPDAWTFALNTESTYDWKAHEWSVPINFTVSKLVKIEEQPISLTAGLC